MYPARPSASEIIANTVSATGTLVTIPAGKWFVGSITISAAVAAAGTSSPVVTVNGVNAAPATGTVIARVDAIGLATGVASNSAQASVLVKAPTGNAITLDFTAGALGTSSVSISGYAYG